MPDQHHLTLRERRPEDLPYLWRWEHAEGDAEWKRWDAPYFHEREAPSTVTLKEFTAKALGQSPSPNSRIIALNGECIGSISRCEEHPRGGGWWEIGVLIHDPASWGGGLGTRALEVWTDATFRETEAHVVTLTTWSGNVRMVRAAERAGYRECGRVPQARLWRGQRWDSVRLCALKREWEARRQDQASRPNTPG
ncbi:GNAT family N-acetyltransferase [Deinococcus hopiensis]|uniref:Protein N-acetyltransferase, RimJ/RimL family n=1 Tax=Deinococcus hopiensis KR-140 TaxID=695939 RepID=A0A1W1VF92_9DEIO|nr:GNAT family protein [Deinococcus hopiensis]SMB91664.1 Protein N-acetyltransferase, RimJ/RimL family [Deinococcus hopiensis KR-140]